MLHSGGAPAEAYALPSALHRAVEEIASSVAFLLGKESSYTTGQAYAVDGGRVC
jgi:NAD(P)-dependent dehydrogenase (short-subunit alcohol dehydrogenase family)